MSPLELCKLYEVDEMPKRYFYYKYGSSISLSLLLVSFNIAVDNT